MSKPDTTRKVLGKGLNALLSARTQAPVATPPPPPSHTDHAPTAKPAKPEDAQLIPIASIDPNPLQPRRHFDDERLTELARSIEANGIVQPLVVRAAGDRYQLVAGERRLRAAKLAGLEKVPVVVREIPEERLLEVTLIENIQREDLNPLETAIAFERLGREFNLTAEAVGQRTGKDRTTVLNFLRLLQLPDDIQKMIADRSLTQGHARALLSLPTADQQREVAQRAVAKAWSVRETERVTQKMARGETPKTVEEVDRDPNVKAALQEMQRALGTRVRIVERPRKGGRIEIDYYSADDLDRIYSLIVRE